jgi:glycosyltransferase involved in cell wall biosynthesis
MFRKESIEIVVIRDLRLALPAILAAKLSRVKTILDLGEHYPGMMEVVGKQNIGHLIIRNIWLIKKLESVSVRSVDMVWVVADENMKRLKSLARQIETINNYPIIDGDVESYRSIPIPYSDSGEPMILISFGIVDSIRGLELAIDAMGILAVDFRNVRLRIYGEGPHLEFLKKYACERSPDSMVEFYGWVSPENRNRILASGHIGLLLHKVCDLTQHTMPNKLFDYMSTGLPVVSTKLNPVIRILEAESCGISVDENPRSVARGICQLISDSQARQRLSENGIRAARERYTWNTEIETIKNSIALLASA